MNRSLFLLPILIGTVALSTAVSAPIPKDPAVFFDDFDGKLRPEWKVVRPDATHVSLKKVPGSLVLTSQRGTIHGKEKEDELSKGIAAKNIHLVPIPMDKNADWVATTCVSGGPPTVSYQQVGMIAYVDDDNYFKWDYEFDGRNRQHFYQVTETEATPIHTRSRTSESGLKRFWMRMTRRDKMIEFEWSKDGENWNEGGKRRWDGAALRQVGIFAKNGGTPDIAELEFAFEFFDLRPAPKVEK